MKIKLDDESPEVIKRVEAVIKSYYQKPILRDKEIILLARGDEGFPTPILINESNYIFNLFAAIDCIFELEDGTLHILDFKTGKSDFDNRQGNIYLLASQYLFPNRSVVASFYNLETQQWSDPITKNQNQLQRLQQRLKSLSQKHQKELKNYRYYKEPFDRVFPPNPGLACKYCQFSSICEYSNF